MRGEAHDLTSVIVHDFNIVGIALAEFETNSPSLAGVHSPKAFSVALEFMKTNALQRAQILKRFRHVQCKQQIDSEIEVESTKLVRPLVFPNLARRRILIVVEP